MSTQPQRGAAIVAAMLLAVLAAAVAAGLLWQQQWNLRQHEFRREQVQAQALVVAGLQWAQQILQEDARAGGVDHLGEPWAIRLPPTPVESGEITGHISDLQGLFNVNGVVRNGRADIAQIAVLDRLLAASGIDRRVARAIVDWVDPDGEAGADGGAEDAAYAQHQPPALAANRPVLRFAELAQVSGLSGSQLGALGGVVSALPEPTAVNVNTAPAELLSALIPALRDDELAFLLRERAASPFASVDDFRARGMRDRHSIPEDRLSVDSRFFLVSVFSRQGQTHAQGRALLRRNGRAIPTVVWQVVE